MDAIRWEGNTLYLLDQAKLPVTEVWLLYIDYRPAADAIRTMVVRGAPAIDVAAAYAYCLAALAGEGPDEAKETLAASRPTAVNLFQALKHVERRARECGGAAEPLVAEAKAIHVEDVAICRVMGAHRMVVVPEHTRILAHYSAGALTTGGCGTALSIVRVTHEAGKVNMVYCDETRPLLQGAHLTTHGLISDHIPATLITDNTAASLMAGGKIDLAVVRYDHTTTNGGFANKVGTYSVAVNAYYHDIPFYVALPCSTIDLSLIDEGDIPIEGRDRDEVRTLYGARTTPESVEICSPAFDVTPHNLVTGIITEKGVIYPPFQESLQKLFG